MEGETYVMFRGEPTNVLNFTSPGLVHSQMRHLFQKIAEALDRETIRKSKPGIT